jgi:hypothetical protein
MGGDCQPMCQNIAGKLGPANETYGQVCWHNESLVEFLVAQAVLGLYPTVTLPYRSTTLYQDSYHIR